MSAARTCLLMCLSNQSLDEQNRNEIRKKHETQTHFAHIRARTEMSRKKLFLPCYVSRSISVVLGVFFSFRCWWINKFNSFHIKHLKHIKCHGREKIAPIAWSWKLLPPLVKGGKKKSFSASCFNLTPVVIMFTYSLSSLIGGKCYQIIMFPCFSSLGFLFSAFSFFHRFFIHDNLHPRFTDH